MNMRVTNQPQFERSLRKVAKKMEADLEDVVQQVAFSLFRGVIERTPVDKGWARASWNIAFGTPDLTVPPPVTGGEGAAAGYNAAQQGKLEILPSDMPTIWITNALPYILPLENGHSKQMGKGFMVQRTLAQVVAEINATLGQLQ